MGNQKKKLSIQERKEELGAKIAERIQRWNAIKENGCSDPFWPDGLNMNLVSNHVIYYKRQCEAELNGDYPQEYYLPTPEKVDGNYIARKDGIKADAKRTLKTMRSNPDYIWLKEKIEEMDSAQKKETSIQSVVGYVDALVLSIEKEDYIDMRRHRKADWYIGRFGECRKKAEEILLKMPRKPEQMSIFDFDVA